jgi:hypothetical protein
MNARNPAKRGYWDCGEANNKKFTRKNICNTVYTCISKLIRLNPPKILTQHLYYWRCDIKHGIACQGDTQIAAYKAQQEP